MLPQPHKNKPQSIQNSTRSSEGNDFLEKLEGGAGKIESVPRKMGTIRRLKRL